MAGRASTPLALHLDHGDGLPQAARCIGCGFTSIMVDGSLLPLAENVRLVRSAVELAHAAGVSVEAELGHVPFGDCATDDPELTEPAEAAGFVEQTGVDALAVAVGTAHGRYKRAPVLDLDRLERIRATVDVPLVLHGGSDTPPAALQRCIALGITKINIATDFQALFLDEMKAQLERQQGRFLPIDVFMKPVVAGLVEFVRAKMVSFGASGRA
jgi:fructose-bisphosphate aldolase class II